MLAAQVFATVLADAGERDVVTLSRASHAVARVLWQQRFFEQAVGAHRVAQWQRAPIWAAWRKPHWTPAVTSRNDKSQHILGFSSCEVCSCVEWLLFTAQQHP
jgi:hypothetical protein